MKLYIAEKASVGRAIAAALPGGSKKLGAFLQCGSDVVAWAAGHLLELYMPEDYDERYRTWGDDTLLYVPPVWKRKEIAASKNLFDPLKKLIKGLDPKSDVVVNAGDADREGQLLIDEILDYCGWTGQKGATKRLRINDVNAPAIRRALENMRDNAEYRGEYMAGQARLYADWLVGLSLTRFVTVSLRKAGYDTPTKSVGRVQAPTLGLVVARDAAIAAFASKPYWELRAVLSLDGGRTLSGRWVAADAVFLDDQKRIVDHDAALALRSKIDGQSGEITQVAQKDHRSAPPLPYSLSKLQIAASQKYDITDTLAHLQKLYEAGYVTYPRTDCDYLPEGHLAEAAKVLEAVRVGCPDMADMMSGVDASRKSPAWSDKKVAEHHAIIPTVRVPLAGALSAAERKIYELICTRYVMQFLPDYDYQETTVEFRVGGENFKSTGRTVQKLGWQGWEKNAKEEGKNPKESGDEEENPGAEDGEADAVQTLPQVRQGEAGNVQASLDEKNTKPPKPYTYHALIKDMNNVHTYVKDAAIRAKLKEVQGIGTAATQEGVIATLFARGYLEKRKKNIFSTELGRKLIAILGDSKASAIVKPDMTALWEQRMGDIERGDAFEPFVAEVADMVREIIAEPLKIPADIPGMGRLEKCLTADCAGFLRRVVKPGKFDFFSCPACGATFENLDGKPVPRKEKSAGEAVEAPCPLGCGSNARRFSGKYGFFWKCRCSPDTTFKDMGGKPAVKDAQTRAACPVEGCKGRVLFLRSKKDQRPFWLCDTCGNFFDDADGTPAIRAAKAKKN